MHEHTAEELPCLPQAPGSTAKVLRQLVTLFALKRLEANMGWLMTEGILTLEAGRALPTEIR